MPIKKWIVCPTCMEMTLDLKKHSCHPLIKRKIDDEIDKLVKTEINHLEKDIEGFWDSKDVKFFEYLLENDKWDTH